MSTRSLIHALSVTLISALGAIGFGYAVASLDAPGLDANRDGKVQTVVVGDSLSAGFYASSEDLGFARLVTDELGPVETLTTARAHQTLATVSGVASVPPGVELAIIELGTNDVGAGTPLEDFSGQYRSLVTSIRAASPFAEIVCLGTWTGWGDDYDEAVENACATVDGTTIPLIDLFRAEENRGSEGHPTFLGPGDDFHPNDLGHRAIADAILRELPVPHE